MLSGVQALISDKSEQTGYWLLKTENCSLDRREVGREYPIACVKMGPFTLDLGDAHAGILVELGYDRIFDAWAAADIHRRDID
jgi:hypothetical protein